MKLRPSQLHLERIEQDLRDMPSTHSFAFAASCAERAWPIYERGARGKSWDKRQLLRGALDSVWEWLAGRAVRPSGLAAQCETAVFDDDHVEPSDAGAFYVSNNVFGLISIVENDQREYAAQSAMGNIDLLDSFLYERIELTSTSENDIMIDNHPLFQIEIERQMDDIAALRQPITDVAIQMIRARARTIGLFGKLWYD